MVANIIKLAVLVILLAIGYKLLFSQLPDQQQPETDRNLKISKNKLLRTDILFNEPQILKVTEHVYVAMGYTFANMIMIEGPEGIIIVDTGESGKACLQVFEELRKISTKPLKAIIISHFHPDHILGASYLLEANKNNGENIEIIMHSDTAHQLKQSTISAAIGFKRMARQFGVFLQPDETNSGKDNEPKFIIEPEAYNRIMSPTKTFTDEAKLQIAGVSITLIHTPGESNDHITVWIPEWRVVMPGDNIFEYFPTIYTIRGNPLRDCQMWYQSLDKVRHLRPQYMIPMHCKPMIGEEAINQAITHLRDALQFVFDQTIRWMNKGLTVDEIVEKVHLPPTLSSYHLLQQFYGKVSWSVRSIFNGYLGWFDGDPVYLNPLPKQKRGRRMAELVNQEFPASTSGVERLILEARKTLGKAISIFESTGELVNDDVQWGLELASEAGHASDENSNLYLEAKAIKSRALELLAMSTSNVNEQNYYLTYAAELEGTIKIAVPEDRKKRAVESSKVGDLLGRLQYRFNAELCDDQEILNIVFNFVDVNQTFCFIMRHCILELVSDSSMMPSDLNAKLTVTTTLWKEMITGKRSPIMAYAKGDILIDGSMSDFRKFMNLIDRD